MKQERVFIGGGMDTDSAIEYIDQRDYISAWNIRNTGTDSQELGYITSIEGTTLIPYALPVGINKCVGGRAFKDLRKAYAFIYNSNLQHLILEYDFDANSLTKIFENITDSGGINILELNPAKYVTDINIINETLYFLPSSRIPSKLDLVFAASGTTVQQQDLMVIRPKPSSIPTAVVSNDSNRVANLIEDKVFKFNTQYIFARDEESVFSEPSKAISSPRSSGQGLNGQFNVIVVDVKVPDDRVESIVVGGQIDGKLQWVEVKRVERSYILSLPNTAVDLLAFPQIKEAYNPTTDTYSFVFYNDGLYPPIDTQLTNLEYDRVPDMAEAQELLNGNILAYGNITEGRDTPEVDVDIIVSYANKVQQQNQGTTNYLVSTGVDSKVTQVGPPPRFRLFFRFSGNIRTGDVITLYTKYTDLTPAETYTYTCPPQFDGNTLGALQDFASKPLGWYETPQVSLTAPYPLASFEFKFQSFRERVADKAVITLANSSTSSYTSLSALKLNSNRQYGIMYEFPYGKLSGVATNNSMIVPTDSYGVTNGNSPIVTLNINSQAPQGAIGYYVVSSGQLTHQKTVYMIGKLDSSGAADQLSFDVTSLLRFNEDHTASVINYSFTQGDRATFALFESGGTPTYFDGVGSNPDPQDLAVTGFEVDDDGSGNIKYILRVQKGTLDATQLSGKNVLIEVYTPKLQAQDNNLFYTIGERYDIVNGQHSVSTIVIDSGEVYIKTREYRNPQDLNDFNTYVVEDLNYSDFSPTEVSDNGRAYLYSKYFKRQTLKAHIRYGDVFNQNTGFNQINRFKSENIYGMNSGQTTDKFGGIMKMRQRSTSLIVFQELEIGYVPVNTTIYEDVTGQSNVAISDKLLNNVRYNGQEIGIGKAVKSFAENDGEYYFIDPNKSQPVKVDRGGVRFITGKMSKFFQTLLQTTTVTKKDIIGYYNEFYREYTASIESENGVVISIPMNKSDWDTDNYVVTPDQITISQPNNGTLTYDNTTGIATYTPDTDYLGGDAFQFSFGSVTRNKCLNVIAAPYTGKWIIDDDASYCEDADNPFGNEELTQVFTKNDCEVGSTGTEVPYTVPANTYFASTQIEANQLAQDDIDANGQDYANANGTCNIPPPTDDYTLGLYEESAGGTMIQVYAELRDENNAPINATVDIIADGHWISEEISTGTDTPVDSVINITIGNNRVNMMNYDSDVYSHSAYSVDGITPNVMDGHNIIGGM